MANDDPVPTGTKPPDSAQSGQYPDGVTKPGEKDESKEDPLDKND